VPSFAAEQLLSPLVETTELRQIRYVSVANVVMAYRKEDLDVRLDGTGFVIPRKEGRAITACTWTSAKWLHTSPADTSLIRSYVGRAGDEERVDLPDAELARLVRAELLELMGIDAEPKFIEITRWRQAMPQYAVGHLDALAGLRERLDRELPGVIVAGAAYDGIGIPDCIQSGKNAAQKLAGSWTEG
jgi:oxygen-dependent protoporphyrinogen oxidase